MPFEHIKGQKTAIDTLTRALRGGCVHHAYRFEGLDGVGKRLTAFAFAQALLCTEQAAGGLGCGECRACRRAVTLTDDGLPLHPDLVFVGMGMYPPAVIGKSETTMISVEQVRRVVLARAAFAPHEQRAQVFVVHDAERFSPNAANALLKTLEEPPPATYFVLMSSQSDRLLDTIRSRSLPIRFGPLPDDVLRTIVREHGVDAARVEEAIALAGGSAALALEAGDPEHAAPREAFVAALMGAVDAADLGLAVQLAETCERDRRKLVHAFRAVQAALALRARRSTAAGDHDQALRAARRYELVGEAIDALGRNASTGFTVPALVASMQRLLSLHDPRQTHRIQIQLREI